MIKINNIIKLSSVYNEFICRNRDRVKSKINWWKTKFGVKDNWNMR